jgi:type II secretory ATPase GspE/PulE/Tfp pilus assembly ATPase PilB-like protein
VIFSSGRCDACYHAGYGQLSGVFEILDVSREIRQMILDQSPAGRIEQQAIEDGMLDLRRSAILKVAQGKTSTEEIFRVIPVELLEEQF